MGKSITELQFKDEALPQQDLSDLPEFGRFTPPPPPGNYRFKFPKDLSQCFDLDDTDKGQRLRLEFTDEAPLTIVSSASALVRDQRARMPIHALRRQVRSAAARPGLRSAAGSRD